MFLSSFDANTIRSMGELVNARLREDTPRAAHSTESRPAPKARDAWVVDDRRLAAQRG